MNRRRILAAATVGAAALATALMNTSGVHAYAQTTGARVTVANDTLHPQSVSEPWNGPDKGCWTSFEPVNPDGGPLDQFYKNCTDVRVRVAAKNLLDGYEWGCSEVNPWQTWHWHWDSTTRGSTYTTVFC